MPQSRSHSKRRQRRNRKMAEKRKEETPSKLRVFFCGAHSTGKTTLLHDVAKLVKIKVIPEVARQLIKDLDVHDYIDWENHPDKFEELQSMILNKQCEVEKMKDEIDYMTDRGIDPLVYAKTYLGEEAYRRLLLTEAAQNSIQRYKKDNCLIFVIRPQKECICDDGFRIPPKWTEMCRFHDVMVDVLSSLRIPHYVIDFLDRQERVTFVLEKLKKSQAYLIKLTFRTKVKLFCDESLPEGGVPTTAPVPASFFVVGSSLPVLSSLVSPFPEGGAPVPVHHGMHSHCM